MKTRKKNRLVALILGTLLGVGAGVWIVIRSTSSVSCPSAKDLPAAPYDETQRVMIAAALSYLTYGCEAAPGVSGTVNEILDTVPMVIVNESVGLCRADENDAATAAVDTGAFIRRQVGDFRFLAAQKDTDSGFYGAVFADDGSRCLWVSYAGAITAADFLTCAGLVAAPGLTRQESAALALFARAMASGEVADGYSVLLTGHSLGGALATAVSMASRCPAVTVNGADGVALDKMGWILGDRSADLVSNYMTSPDNGRFAWLDLVQRLMFLGSWRQVDAHVYEENGLTEDAHCVFSFVRFPDGTEGEPALPAEN